MNNVMSYGVTMLKIWFLPIYIFYYCKIIFKIRSKIP